jgi:predicted CxxxxCH...CXXCH cytochrome family protein
VHAKHAGSPLPEGTANSKEFDCEICHFGYSPNHNQSGYSAGQQWTSFDPATVNINFDNTWNPGATYAGNTMPTTGVGTTGACDLLYCHGNRADQSDWAGTSTTTPPKWDNTVSAPCGSCHNAGAGLTNANHPVHLDNTTNPFGPGIDNASCAAGGACHTAYGLSPTATHVDKMITFRNSADNTLSSTTTCNNCHTQVVIASFDNSAPNTLNKSGVDLAKENWADNTYKLPCLTCHNKTSQGNTSIDGTGNSAPNIEAHWLVTGHGASVIDNTGNTGDTPGDDPPVYRSVPVPCRGCHDIASSHFASTGKNTVNPWRLWNNTKFSNNNNGEFDIWCAGTCHSVDPPANHTWNVAAEQSKESGDTHKTSTDIVPDSNIYQVPPATMPLEPFLTDKGAGAAGSDWFLCITCHDPHGIGKPAAAPRTFNGDIDNNAIGNDNVHMLRHDYGEGSGSTLCKNCHI